MGHGSRELSKEARVAAFDVVLHRQTAPRQSAGNYATARLLSLAQQFEQVPRIRPESELPIKHWVLDVDQPL